MTPQQRNILDLVRTSIETRGVSPSFKELAEGIGSSRTHAFTVANALVRHGHLVRTGESRRNLRLPDMVDLRSATTAALEAELERRRG